MDTFELLGMTSWEQRQVSNYITIRACQRFSSFAKATAIKRFSLSRVKERQAVHVNGGVLVILPAGRR